MSSRCRPDAVGCVRAAHRTGWWTAGVLALTPLGAAAIDGLGLAFPSWWVPPVAGAVIGTNCVLPAVGVVQLARARARDVALVRATAEVIERRGWQVVRHVDTRGVGVGAVRTPHAVLAVVVARHGVNSPDGVRRRLRADREIARREARTLGLAGPDGAAPVPVLVVWGPGSEYLPDGSCEVDGVWELAGDRSQLWPERLDRPEHRAPVVVLHPATQRGPLAATRAG